MCHTRTFAWGGGVADCQSAAPPISSATFGLLDMYYSRVWMVGSCVVKMLTFNGLCCYLAWQHESTHIVMMSSWTSCQIREIAGCACAGMPGTFSSPLRVSDPDMHHGTCVTHVPWCMSGSLTSSFLWSRRRLKRSRHSRRMCNLQFYVSGKRSIMTSTSRFLKVILTQ